MLTIEQALFIVCIFAAGYFTHAVQEWSKK
jgi:hypothetical protein